MLRDTSSAKTDARRGRIPATVRFSDDGGGGFCCSPADEQLCCEHPYLVKTRIAADRLLSSIKHLMLLISKSSAALDS
ncbi:hypothetical protein L1987_63867 [Smallanthus sonchifolius]|uniref:Uncharacterized protein n=1 Tax=Smallanthus sonchifolius TaxID=185202 RepID=A0ACB9CEI9_9ASTR|nr:hypothetical protein L1987_63867 [Smallanthus sonchifolius]